MIKWLLTGGLVPVALMGCGIFFLIYLGGRPMRSPRWMLRAMRTPAPGGGTSPMRAVMLALAGTLGVGNIVGVANAVYIGGAGAILWMWISALAAMILKYAEIVLAVSHRREHRRGGFFGGAYYYIKDCLQGRGFARLAAVAAALFAVLMAVDALSMGCIVQVSAVSHAVSGVTGAPIWLGGAVLALLTLPILVRGGKSISALTEVLVPIMTVGYVILSVAVLAVRHEAVGAAFASIFREAFRAESVGGGVVGCLTSRALRTGTMRGLLSNEAGCGTAPTAHAEADAVSPAAQGVWGIFEVFVDTVLLCTATALVILVAYPAVEPIGNDPVMMAIRAYSSVLGGWSEWFFCAAVFCFGYATLLCWANYGMQSVAFLSSRKRFQWLYLLLFAICACFGGSLPASLVWDVSDFAIAALTCINLAVLILMRKEVKRETVYGE